MTNFSVLQQTATVSRQSNRRGFRRRCVLSTGLSDKQVFELLIAIKAVARIVDEDQAPDDRLDRIRLICQHLGMDALFAERPARSRPAKRAR